MIDQDTRQPYERAALALWLLMQAPHTTQAMAERLSMTSDGARKLLHAISSTVPIYHHKGLWRICHN